MKLDEELLGSFKSLKSFKNGERINNIDFHYEGKLLVVGSDSNIDIYDCHTAKLCMTTPVAKYGCASVKTVAASNCVLHTSARLNHDVRCLQMDTNSYLRYFSGHTEIVYDVVPSKVCDTFITVSLDNTMKFWDLRNPNYTGEINAYSYPRCTSLSSTGLVFSSVSGPDTLKMFDLRKYQQGPFSVVNFKTHANDESAASTNNYNKNEPITYCLASESSLNDKYIYVAVANDSNYIIHTIDSYKGETISTKVFPLPTLLSFNDLRRIPPSKDKKFPILLSKIGFTFSADSNYILGFSPNDTLSGILNAWNTKTGTDITLKNPIIYKHKIAQHERNERWVSCPSACNVKFNPMYMMMATSVDDVLNLWQPCTDQ
uniref:WD repeat-containing protein 82 n=1 Tax=Salmo salar TaxID=8030 RepID=B5XEN0_SALSA|nr:WD repeat-containing protein 82 [Salmo salar]